MSNELESDSAMVMNLERFGVDGAGYDETETETPSSTNPHCGSEDHVSGHSDCTFKVSCLNAVFVFVTLVFADMPVI